MKPVTEERAHEVIESLSAYFKVPTPEVIMDDERASGPEGKGAYMDSLKRAIHLGPNADENALVHEFAHVLDLDERGFWAPRNEMYGPHGRGFYERLLRVLKAHFGDPSKYPSWHRHDDEYGHLRRWAHEDGYTNVEPKIDQLEDLLTMVGAYGSG